MSVSLHFYLLFCMVCLTPMRFPRVKAEGQSFYHCVSRVVVATVAAYIELNPVRAGLLCRSQRLSLLRLCRGARQRFLPGSPGYQSCSGPLRCNLLERSQRAV